MSVAGALLLAGVRRAAPDALRGLPRTAGAALLAAGVAVAAAAVLPTLGRSLPASIATAVVLTVVVAVVFLGLLRLLDPAAMRTLRDA
jgi:hypothetical protein